MTLGIVFSAVALACYISLGVVTIRQNIRSRTNRAFVLYLAAMAFWQFTALMVSFSKSAASALFWYKLMVAGGVGLFIFHLFFVLVFLGMERQRGWFYAGWLIFVLLLVCSGANLILESVSKSESTGLYVPSFGPLIPAVIISGFSFFGYGTYSLIQVYRRTKSNRQRNRIRYLLIGVGVITVGSLTNFVPTLQAYPIDRAASVVNACLIAYAILRYQLLDIRVVVRKGLLYSIPTAIIGILYFVMIFFAVQFFHAFIGYQILILSLLIAAVTAVVARPLQDKAQFWIDRLFFREKYDSRLMLQRLSRTAASVLDLDRLTNMILDEVTTTIRIRRAAFFLRQEESGEFHLTAQRGSDQNVGSKLRKDHLIVEWLSSYEHAPTKHDVEVMSHFKALSGEEREELKRMGVELFIPLEAKGKLVGILAVGPKLSEETYSQDDQLTLTTLASQVAVAIENARLYEQAQQEIAERNRAEEALKQTQVQLLQAQKMESIGQLAAGIAHDFNNLLTPISGFAELLLLKASEDSRQQEYLRQIKIAAERAAALTGRLRLFTRQVEGERRSVQLNSVVEETRDLLEHSIPKEIAIELRLESELWVVEADPSQISQVLMNLCLNAHDAMPDGGTLTLETRNVTLDEEQAQAILAARPGRYVRLSVSDTGSGMSPEVQARLFEPFFTTKEVGGGTGLGLAVVYGIVKGHGGFINVYSEVGRGSTFHVYLPAVELAVEGREVEGLELPTGTETILVVDDEEMVRALGQRVLELCGYTVLMAEDGLQALEVYQAHQGEIALVVLDVVMPQMGGLECLRRLRELDPQVKVLISTGYTSKGLAQELVAEGALGVVEKPFRLQDFATAVRTTIDG